METTVNTKYRRLAFAAVAATLVAILLLAIVGWNKFGTEILFTYAESALAWCL